jgi:exoribonuclease-2
LLQRSGAIDSPYQFHWKRFLLENFPQGVGFAATSAPAITEPLPRAPVSAFSIDDSATTEIDDALSVQGLDSGTVTVGVHIAAPGLALVPEGDIDRLGRARLSTVYMPGYKVTMLPDAVVQNYTLQEGRDCPAVSLYVTLDEATLTILASETRLESVPISHNLRYDQLDAIVTEEWLQSTLAVPGSEAAPLAGLQPSLAFLHRLARDLKAKRELVRGKPETFNRPDYNFKLVGSSGAEPHGDPDLSIGAVIHGRSRERVSRQRQWHDRREDAVVACATDYWNIRSAGWKERS